MLAIGLLIAGFALFFWYANKPATQQKIENKLEGREPGYRTVDDRYNIERVKKQKAVDAVLDKISTKGIDALTAGERRLLEEAHRD